jgi:glycine oxidase
MVSPPLPSYAPSQGGYNNRMDSADVVIVGGGVIGLTTAYFLAREGADVLLLDQGGDFGQEASWAGAGILPPSDAAQAQTPFDRLRALSVSMFPQLSAELRAQTGIDNGYLRCGGLEFADPSHRAAEEEWRGQGVRCRKLSSGELLTLEPNVAPNRGDVWLLPDLAQVRNPRHLRALIAACGERVRMVSGSQVTALETSGTRVTGVRTLAAHYRAGRVLLAAGAWTDALLEPLGWRPEIRPVRGQIALLHAPQPPFRHVLLCGSRYLVPRSDGRVLVGSTEEWVGYDKRTTATAIHELLSLAFQLAPILREAALERCWAGLRPGSPDGLPFLGLVPGWDNVYVAAGHFRAGIQLSVGTALVMKELLLGQEPTLDLAPFRLGRER